MIILDQILRKLAENNIITNESVKIPEFIEMFLEEFLLYQLKDNNYLELIYLESPKYDFGDIPLEEEKRKEYKAFMLDDRRFVNKSIKLLIENEILTEYVYKSFLEAVAKLFLSLQVDPNSIEIDLNNQEEEYLQLIEQKKNQIELDNKKFEKMKKKLRVKFVKPEDLKKKRDNIGGFITVQPNKQVLDSNIEIEEPIIIQKNNMIIPGVTNVSDENMKSSEILDIDELKNNGNLKPETEQIKNEIVPVESNVLPNEIIEPLKTKVDYLNEVDLFKNSFIPIDTYILHMDLTECFISYTLRSIKRVLAKNYKVNIDLNQSFNLIKQRINEINSYVYEHVMKNEKYMGKSIIPIEVKPELPPVNAEADLNLAPA